MNFFYWLLPECLIPMTLGPHLQIYMYTESKDYSQNFFPCPVRYQHFWVKWDFLNFPGMFIVLIVKDKVYFFSFNIDYNNNNHINIIIIRGFGGCPISSLCSKYFEQFFLNYWAFLKIHNLKQCDYAVTLDIKCDVLLHSKHPPHLKKKHFL